MQTTHREIRQAIRPWSGSPYGTLVSLQFANRLRARVQDDFTNATLVDSPSSQRQRELNAPDHSALGQGDSPLPEPTRTAHQLLAQSFGVDFTLLDVGLMQVVADSRSALPIDCLRWTAVCREVGSRGKPEIVEDTAPVALLAVPLAVVGQPNLVALGLFCTQADLTPNESRAAADALGCSHDRLEEWLAARTPWHADSILRVARLVATHLAHRFESEQQQEELLETSAQLLTTYEEISLLHRLTEHLSISSGEAELASLAIGWLADVVPAEAVAVFLHGARSSSGGQAGSGRSDATLTKGELPIDERQLAGLVDALACANTPRPVVANRLHVTKKHWAFPGVRDAVLVPVVDGGKARGWLVALNHTGDLRLGSRDFGTVEARLLGSVATILAIHGSNLGLFQEQTDFFEEVVRALTSAIDAKDPYTCGHSDRVARVSVCLARQLGLSTEELNTMYLSGLLHDIGKIGIEDVVLRKPDRLTDEEFEHIKQHPELGYKILKGVKRLDKAIPVVLHHHEAWDGSGYPHGLAGEEIPYMARICAVADAFDAMGSDRPYRAGMPDEKLDSILKNGAGSQWDAKIIDAFFAVREEVRWIARQERTPLSLNVQQWQG